MTEPTSIDVLDDLTSDEPTTEPAVELTSQEEPSEDEPTEDEPTEETENEETPEPENILTEVPPGTKVMSITEFAGHMTGVLMQQAVLNGEPPDISKHYVVPQSVYQTVRALRERIPHIKVQSDSDKEADKEARVYILVDDAQPWWLARSERLSTRGQGTARASARTPEDNLGLLQDAAYRRTHAVKRQVQWAKAIEDLDKLVVKYQGFLSEQNVSESEQENAIQTGTDQYNSDLAEKAKNRKRNKENVEANA